jgi:hypothetical protein
MTRNRPMSTFQRAIRLFTTISGREEYTDPGEKFENVTLVLFRPVVEGGPQPWVKLIDAKVRREMTEQQYFHMVRDLYHNRNPHAVVEAMSDEENGTARQRFIVVDGVDEQLTYEPTMEARNRKRMRPNP